MIALTIYKFIYVPTNDHLLSWLSKTFQNDSNEYLA